LRWVKSVAAWMGADMFILRCAHLAAVPP
jgi:hypothetical protein